MEKFVWTFTNGKKLTAKEFCDYFERKVFRTIREYGMLKNYSGKEIPVLEGEDLNKKVLKYVLSTKFKVKLSKNSLFSYKNLSEIAETIFKNILKGEFQKNPTNLEKSPLQWLKDEEVELYASLKNICGKKRKKDERIQRLFQRFKQKNPDLENNILRAFLQIKKKTNLKMFKQEFNNFLKESARDVLSLGSIAFLVLVIARAMTGQHNQIVLQIVLSSFFLLIFSFFVRGFEYHLSLGFILLVFTIIFYEYKPYRIFSVIVYFFMVLAAFYLKKDKKQIFKGILLGILSTFLSYFFVKFF